MPNQLICYLKGSPTDITFVGFYLTVKLQHVSIQVELVVEAFVAQAALELIFTRFQVHHFYVSGDIPKI